MIYNVPLNLTVKGTVYYAEVNVLADGDEVVDYTITDEYGDTVEVDHEDYDILVDKIMSQAYSGIDSQDDELESFYVETDYSIN